MKLSALKTNPNNPRICKDDKFFKLVNSILEFPKMMGLRPMVYDEENIIQGGNMRSKALIHIKSEGEEKALKHLESVGKPENISFFEFLFSKGEIPDSWAKKATDLTEEEKRRFVIADNVGFGEWDNDILANEWDSEQLEEWGMEIPITIEELEQYSKSDEEFEKDMKKFDDSNCQLPIVPDFFESHECFIIPIHNEIDEKFIRDLFDINQNFISNSGDQKVRKTNVIDVEKLKQWAAK